MRYSDTRVLSTAFFWSRRRKGEEMVVMYFEGHQSCPKYKQLGTEVPGSKFDQAQSFNGRSHHPLISSKSKLTPRVYESKSHIIYTLCVYMQ